MLAEFGKRGMIHIGKDILRFWQGGSHGFCKRAGKDGEQVCWYSAGEQTGTAAQGALGSEKGCAGLAQ